MHPNIWWCYPLIKAIQQGRILHNPARQNIDVLYNENNNGNAA
jgi:hypothetical protein